MKIAHACLLWVALALPACIPGFGREEPPATPVAVAEPRTPDRLIGFDVTVDATLLGSFAKIGPVTWEGPHPDNGQVVTWTETRADHRTLELFTETPRIRTLTVRSDGRITALGLTDAILQNPVFQ